MTFKCKIKSFPFVVDLDNESKNFTYIEFREIEPSS